MNVKLINDLNRLLSDNKKIAKNAWMEFLEMQISNEIPGNDKAVDFLVKEFLDVHPELKYWYVTLCIDTRIQIEKYNKKY